MKAINKDLKKALESGKKKREAKKSAANSELQNVRSEHDKMINKHLPKARKWIKEKFFRIITEYEAEGKHSYLLGSFYEDGIPSEAIYEAAKKINGLKPKRERFPIYEHAEYVGDSEPVYSIEWDSIDQ